MCVQMANRKRVCFSASHVRVWIERVCVLAWHVYRVRDLCAWHVHVLGRLYLSIEHVQIQSNL